MCFCSIWVLTIQVVCTPLPWINIRRQTSSHPYTKKHRTNGPLRRSQTDDAPSCLGSADSSICIIFGGLVWPSVPRNVFGELSGNIRPCRLASGSLTRGAPYRLTSPHLLLVGDVIAYDRIKCRERFCDDIERVSICLRVFHGECVDFSRRRKTYHIGRGERALFELPALGKSCVCFVSLLPESTQRQRVGDSWEA